LWYGVRAETFGKDFPVYLILVTANVRGGQVWEMALFLAQHKLGNFYRMFLITTCASGWYVTDILY
jgi:transketolase N-terminal domain/subunit